MKASVIRRSVYCNVLMSRAGNEEYAQIETLGNTEPYGGKSDSIEMMTVRNLSSYSFWSRMV
jgi:hypothetical protein